MKTFREWMKDTKRETEDLSKYCFFESFDSHYDIISTHKNNSGVTFYEFKVSGNKIYRIFIEQIKDIIHLGFVRQEIFITKDWIFDGIFNDLKNGEIQKLFGTIIYVIKNLYKEEYNAIKIKTNEDKKFRLYLRLIKQISSKILPNSEISHDNKNIHIYKLPKENETKIQKTEFKYNPKK